MRSSTGAHPWMGTPYLIPPSILDDVAFMAIPSGVVSRPLLGRVEKTNIGTCRISPIYKFFKPLLFSLSTGPKS